MHWVRLGDIASKITKGTTPTSIGYDFVDEGINFIKIESITENGTFLQNKFAHITSECNEKLGRSQLNVNDILFSIAGAIGRTAIVSEDILPANTNQAIAIIRVPEGSIDYSFLMYALESPALRKQYESQKQGVAQINLSLQNVSDFLIPKFGLDEQRRIAAVLDKVSCLIAKRREQLDKLDELVKAWFVEIMQSVPLSEKLTIEEITERVKVGFVGTCEKYYTDTDGVPMLRTRNITDHGVTLTDLKYVTREFHKKNKKSQIKSGDLLIARHGSNGQANVYKGPEAQCLNAVVIVPNQEIVKSEFLAALINSDIVKQQIEKTLVGSTQRVVNTKSIANLIVQIPSLPIQNLYEDFVLQTDKSKLTIQQSLDKLEVLKKALMQQYFG